MPDARRDPVNLSANSAHTRCVRATRAREYDIQPSHAPIRPPAVAAGADSKRRAGAPTSGREAGERPGREDGVLLQEADLVTALFEAASPDAELLAAAEARLRHWPEEAGGDSREVDWGEVGERLRAALVGLLAARALGPVTASRCWITARGRGLLRHRAEGIDGSLPARFPEYRRRVESRRIDGRPDPRHDAFLAGM